MSLIPSILQSCMGKFALNAVTDEIKRLVSTILQPKPASCPRASIVLHLSMRAMPCRHLIDKFEITCTRQHLFWLPPTHLLATQHVLYEQPSWQCNNLESHHEDV